MIRTCFNNGIVDVIGLCDTENFTVTDNWTEISIPEVLTIPDEKPDIETVEKVFVKVKIMSKRLIKTPASTGENAEGTKLTGIKLIIEGVLKQKIVYTADVPEQSVHSAHFDVPFSAFIVMDPTIDLDLDPVYCVETCVEDVFVKPFNGRQAFKNVTLLLKAEPLPTCP